MVESSVSNGLFSLGWKIHARPTQWVEIFSRTASLFYRAYLKELNSLISHITKELN